MQEALAKSRLFIVDLAIMDKLQLEDESRKVKNLNVLASYYSSPLLGLSLDHMNHKDRLRVSDRSSCG